MKALSIRQPWAWLILHAGKDVENRDWRTTFRGRVLIHASKGCTRDEYASAVDFALDVSPHIAVPPLAELDRGGIVGSVEIVGCVRDSTSPWFVGEWGFVLQDAQPQPFEPCVGALGFFAPAHASKVAWVRSASQTRVHECHWPGCTRQVPPAMWGCRDHWFALPKLLRDRIWATYSPGQESSGTPSAEYLDAATDVQEWIAARQRVAHG